MADFTLDARQAFATFDAIERRLSELEGVMKRTQSVSKTVFTGGLDSARKEIQTLDQVQREYQELDQMVNRFKANLKNAWDPRAVATYARAIEEAEVEMRRLERGASAVGVNLKKSLSQDTKGLGASLLDSLKGAALAAGAGISFGAAIKEGVALAAEYEKVKTSLTVILKDAGKADALLGKLSEFAAKTPFESGPINQAATALLAFGESETTVIEKLRQIGDISSGTGKDLNDLAVIYGKARVQGTLFAEDINQLTEAGVPIIQEFAKQMGVSESQVKKLASEGRIGFGNLEKAFQSLTSEGGRFAGLMEAQSKTIGGQLSTLSDNAKIFLRSFVEWSGITEIVKRVSENLGNLFNAISRKITPATETATQKVRALQSEFNLEIDVLKRANFTQSERARAIQEINTKYKDYLPNLLSEKASLNDIEAAQRAVNNLLEQKILFIAFEDEYKKVVEAGVAATKAAFVAEKERVKINEQLRTQTTDVGRFEEAQRQRAKFFEGFRDQSLKTAQQAPEDAKKIEEAFSELAKKLGTSLSEIRKRFQTVTAPEKGASATSGESATAKQIKKDLADLEKVAATIEQVRAAVAPDDLSEDLARVNKKYDDLVKATEEGILKLQQIEKQRGLTPEQRVQLEELSAFTVQLEARRLDELTSVLLDFNEKEIALADEQEKRKIALSDKILQGDKDAIQEQKNIRDDAIKLQEERGKQLIAVLKKAGADEKEIAELQRQFDLATQKARLESELQFQQQLLEIVGAGNEAQAAEIKRTIAQLKAEIGTLSIEIDAPPVSGGGKKQSLFDLLGIDTSTAAGAEFADQIEEMAGRAIAALQEMAQARTELAQQEVEASDNRISTLESELDREIQLAELGFASNVTLKRKQLEEEKKKNAAVKAELERAKKSQLAIDTAIQASSLITSIANLFKSLSLLPFGTGIPIAIALSGLMIGFFIKSKIDAAKAAKARFGKSSFLTSDGMVEGRTHARGGHLLEVEHGEMVQVGDDGGRRRVEVVRRERAREYFDLLRAANKGNRMEIARQAMKLADVDSMPLHVRARLYPSVNLQEMYKDVPRVSRKKVFRRVFGSDKMQAIEVTVNGGDTTQTNRLLEQIIRLHIESAQAEKWSPDGMVRTKGNTKTRYR